MFRITVEEIMPKPEGSSGYDREPVKCIYAQMVTEINLVAVIDAVNQKEKK